MYLFVHILFKFLFCVYKCLLTYIEVYHTWVLGAQEARSVEPPGTGVTKSCELPYGSWELNSGPI